MSIKPLYEFDEELRQFIIKQHLEMPRGGKVSGPEEGTYGEVYSILLPGNVTPRLIAAKCPRIKRFGSLENAQAGLEQILYELDKTHKVFTVPWVNRYFDVQLVHGWPFLLSRFRDGTLEELIANRTGWSLQDRFASLLQIVRALRLAQDRGIAAHQDLKPANIFFDNLSLKGVPTNSKGMHFHIYVADFGLADAFRDYGRNSGSRPYMAPEQYLSEPIDLAGPVQFDVFALGVIAFECFSGGNHPIGVATADFWPWRPGVPRNRWDSESTWREWAQSAQSTFSPPDGLLPKGIGDLVRIALSARPEGRPTLEEFESRLWEALQWLDPETCAGLKMQIEYLEGLSSDEGGWPHMDQRLLELRKFYAERPNPLDD